MVTLGNLIRMKAVIVGDSDVLKTHFLMQTAGLYQRERAGTSFYMQDYLLDLELYDKAVDVAIWNTCKFTFDRVDVVQRPHISGAGQIKV